MADLPDRPHVAICIATFRRPEGLRALLASLDTQVCDAPAPRVTVIVVDNCPEAPATATLGDLSALSRHPLIAATEPRRGIVAARNRALALVPADADAVAFLDDDETAAPRWLAEMLRTLGGTDAAAVQGPVVPRYDVPPPAWVTDLRIFVLGPFVQGERLNFAATNNVLVDAATLRRLGLRFDPRFNDTGGEDEEMFGRLREGGGIIRAAALAEVTDTVPANRLTLAWALRRRFRMGNTLGRIARLRGRGRVMRLIKGLGAMARGGATVVLAGFGSRTRLMGGLLETARGAGMIAAFANLRFSEYSAAAVLSDRHAER